MINQAVIFCGGLGTRLLPLTKKIPKPMVLVDDKPFLHHLVSQSKQNGIKNFLILYGYKHEVIKKYFGDGSKFGVKIKYHYNDPKIETLKRLLDARHLIKKSFLLLYGDNYSSLNLHDLINQKYCKKNSLLITVCKKKCFGNIQLNEKNNLITEYFFKKQKFLNYVEIGYMILNKNILPKTTNPKNISFSHFINYCVQRKKAFFYLNDTGYLSISDSDRLKISKKFFKQKIILLDRDGVINQKNKKHFYVRSLNELKINYKFIKKYYQLLKNKKIICITNQAGIFTGDVTKKNLKLIHKKIIQVYKKKKLNLVDFFISTQHFTSTHIDRKPRHGLFLRASKKHKFILDKTVYIGDDLRDAKAAYAAKTKFLYEGKEKFKKNLLVLFKNTLIKNYKNV